jgi:hypothetical protein
MNKKISKSPDRHTFQRDQYIKHQKEKGETIDGEYLRVMNNLIENAQRQFDDPEARKNDLEYDLRTTDWILAKVRGRRDYAQNLYAALCNNEFQRNDVIPILRNEIWSCTWRSAGGIVADMREEGDYIDWYCSGMRGNPADDPDTDENWSYVGEGVITDEVREDLFRMGWIVVNEND